MKPAPPALIWALLLGLSSGSCRPNDIRERQSASPRYGGAGSNLIPPTASALPLTANDPQRFLTKPVAIFHAGPNVGALRPRAEPLQSIGAGNPRHDWPQWRGIQRDGACQQTGLLQQWPAGGPKLNWTQRTLGYGLSGPAVAGGRVFTLGSSAQGTIALALDLETGRRLWTVELDPHFENAWGNGPRGTPTVDGERLFVLTARGLLACLETATGRQVWSRSLERDFGGETPDWGYSESPLVDGDRVLVTPGGENTIVALDKRTGELAWHSTGLDDGAQYSSLIRASFAGQSMVLNMTDRGLVAVSSDNGKLLWRYPRTKNGTAICGTPLYHAGHVYSTSGFGTGCGLVQLMQDGAGVAPREIYFNPFMKNQHGGVVLVAGHIYGYSDGTGWVCQNFLTGDLVWTERHALSKGSIAYADGRLYCYGEQRGTVVLAEASPDGWQEQGRFTIPESSRLDRDRSLIWTHPVIAQGRLLLRDQELLFSFDITSPAASSEQY